MRRKRSQGPRHLTELDQLMGFGPDEPPYNPQYSSKGDSIDAGPFLEWYEWRMRIVRLEHASKNGWDTRDRGPSILSIVGETDQRRISSMRATGRGTYQVIDRILTKLDGPPLALLYPADDDVVAA